MKMKINVSWWGIKISFLLFKINLERKVKRFLFCKRDWHRLRPQHIIVTNSKKEKIECCFLECIICDTCFFRNEEDKKSYVRIKEKDRSMLKQLFNFKPKGKIKVREFK